MANTKRNILDERNKLYLEYIRILKDKKPKMFVAENVKGILSLGNGSVIKAIVNDFSDAGYNVQYKLLNAADYGVPQRRQRVIIVGVRKDLKANFDYPSPIHSNKVNDKLNKWVTVKDALSIIPDPDGANANSVPNNEYSNYKLLGVIE